MPTEEYKYLKPWVCPGCSAELQFSEAHGSILQYCFIGIALLLLYLVGLRSWQLAIAVIPAGIILTFIFTGPLDRILPRRLELYSPPPWKRNKEEDRFVEDKFVTLFPREDVDGDKAKKPDQAEDEPTKEP
jgi:hypothetical protein